MLTCEAHYQVRRWTHAEAVARELLSGNPEHVAAHRWLGAIYYDLGAASLAEHHLKELARLAPQDYSPHRLLGLIHKDFVQLKEAITDYQSALERNPPTSVKLEICRELAQSQIQQTDFDGAMKTLDLVVADSDLELQMLRAECLWTLDRKDEAKDALLAAEKRDREAPSVLRLSARFALDENRPHDAIQCLEQLTKLDPADHQALLDLSLAYRRVDRVADADQFLERRNAVFALLERRADLNMKAIREPANLEVRIELAKVCDELGKKELADVWRQAAQSLRDLGNSPR